MNSRHDAILFASGIAVGLVLATCIGANYNAKQARERAEWEKLHPKVRQDIDSAFGVN